MCFFVSGLVVRLGVRNLQISDETTNSLEASWELEDPLVDQYRVTYTSLRGDRAEEAVSMEEVDCPCLTD